MDLSFIHPTSIAEAGSIIGKGTKVWHFSHIMPGAEIGENCIIGQNVFIGAGVVIGNNVKIQNNVSICTGVICGNDVFIGPSTVFTNVINPRAFIDRKMEFKPTLIKKGASAGANCTIICGSTIGEYAMLGAGSVLTKSMPGHSLWYGNPAKLQGWVSRCGIKLNFKDGNRICQVDGIQYQLDGHTVKLNSTGDMGAA